MTRFLIAALLMVSCCAPSVARAEPAPAEQLSWSVDQRDVKMSWRMPKQDLAVRYYLDICRFERGSWLRIYGTYVDHPPFTFERPAPQTSYAWRVLSVDAGNERSFTPTPWQVLRLPPPSR